MPTICTTSEAPYPERKQALVRNDPPDVVGELADQLLGSVRRRGCLGRTSQRRAPSTFLGYNSAAAFLRDERLLISDGRRTAPAARLADAQREHAHQELITDEAFPAADELDSAAFIRAKRQERTEPRALDMGMRRLAVEEEFAKLRDGDQEIEVGGAARGRGRASWSAKPRSHPGMARLGQRANTYTPPSDAGAVVWSIARSQTHAADSK